LPFENQNLKVISLLNIKVKTIKMLHSFRKARNKKFRKKN